MTEPLQVSARAIGNRDLDRLQSSVIVHELGHALGTLCALNRDVDRYDSMNPRISRDRDARVHRFTSDFYRQDRTPEQEFISTVGGVMAGAGFMSVAFPTKTAPDWSSLSPREMLAHGIKESLTSPGDVLSLIDIGLEMTSTRQALVLQFFLFGQHAARDEIADVLIDLKNQVDEKPEGVSVPSGLLTLIGEPDYQAAAKAHYSKFTVRMTAVRDRLQSAVAA